MFSGNRHHGIKFSCLYRRGIALAQLLVILMLAVPACCYELETEHDNAGVSRIAKTNDADNGSCPCCPDENKTDSDNDTCSSCSYCSHYAPLTPLVSTKYYPSVAPLISPEQFTKLTDVHIPIFVPPQNLA